MIYGNWVAIRKVFLKYLPDDRPFTKLEAVISVATDFDSGNLASYAGYSKLWKWSRNKVKKFMNEDLELTIEKPQTSEEIRLQKGKIKGHPKGHPRDTPSEKKGQPKFVFNMGLHDIKDTPSEKKGQPRDTPKDTTIDPNIILNPKDKKKSIKKTDKKQKTDPPNLDDVQDFIDSISEATKNLCREKNIGQSKFKQLAETCFDHFRGKGEQKMDWESTVRNWIRNDEKFNNKNSPAANSGNTIADRMTKQSDLTSQATREIL